MKQALCVAVVAVFLSMAGCERRLNTQANDTAASGPDLTNSARASGSTNLPQPPSTDNPPPGVATVGPAAASAGAASQSTSSQTTGTSPMPDNGSQPRSRDGTTGTKSGGGTQL